MSLLARHGVDSFQIFKISVIRINIFFFKIDFNAKPDLGDHNNISEIVPSLFWPLVCKNTQIKLDIVGIRFNK